ncbi:putative major ampullate spidroin 2 [Toxoplasma gondii VAND]|uniref:Putative major ampullate spidroin 2 n=1 Tax=Toxoplasma gondii VAND TaxID=933077 RepID=A0A086PKA9_TOXGO|nr:putative major ampullate spidroin 2 [Toxoplasma gondii VAND]
MPYRSSSSPADIGLSKSEYEDAVNLEKLYFLANKNDRCANCGRGGVSAVDVSRYEFLCSSCCSGKSSVKRIGEDRFSSFEVNKLHARFDRNTHRGRSSASYSRSGTSGSGGARRSDRRGERRSSHRPPVPELSEGSESDSGDDSPPPPRRSRSMPRGSVRSPRHSYQRSSSHRPDPFDTFEEASNASWGGPAQAAAPAWGVDFGSSQGAAQRAPQVGLGGQGTSPAGMLGLAPVAPAPSFGQGFQFPGMAGMGNPAFMGAAQGASPQAWGQNAFLASQYQAMLRPQFPGAAGRDAGVAFPGSGPTAQPPGMMGQSPNYLLAGAAGPMRPTSPMNFPGPQAQPGQRGVNPFLTMGAGQQATHPGTSPFQAFHPTGATQVGGNAMGGAPMNPFLSVQKPSTATGGLGDGGMFGGTSLDFASQHQTQHMRQQGPGAAAVVHFGGGPPAAPNPFSSMGVATPQRSMALTNEARPGGGVGGNPYNTSLW